MALERSMDHSASNMTIMGQMTEMNLVNDQTGLS